MKVTKEKNLGFGPQAGAREALAGHKPISAIKYLLLLYILYLLGGKVTDLGRYQSLPKLKPNRIFGSDFYRSGGKERKTGGAADNPDKKRRLKAKPATVMAQKFSVCHCTKQISKVTKTLILLSDFIFRSESRSPKMASKAGVSQPQGCLKLGGSEGRSGQVDAAKTPVKVAEANLMHGRGEPQKLDGVKRGRGPSSDTSTPNPPSKRLDERTSAEKVGEGKDGASDLSGKAGKKSRKKRRKDRLDSVSSCDQAPAPTEPERQKAKGKAKKRKVQETYAEVVKTNHVCYIKERGGEELLGPDLVKLQDFVCELYLSQDEVDLTIEKGGLRDGCVWFALRAKEAVEWLRAKMHLLKPLKESHTGYDFYGPGEVPVRVFFVETSDVNALKDDRFVRLVKKSNRGIFGNVEGGLSVMESAPLKDKEGLRLKVSLDHGLVPALAAHKYEVYYGFGKVKFQKPMPDKDKKAKKSKKVGEGSVQRDTGLEQGGQVNVDHDVDLVDLSQEGDDEDMDLSALYGSDDN